MKISILSIGDEICIGQVVNTNAAWIAEEFTKQGASIIFHSIIPDNFSFIKSEIYRLWDYSDVIISTGGLGPTHDDITKKALTELFNDKLEFNEKAYKQLEEFFKKRNKKITKRNKEQAMLPSKCEAIINPVGTASGMKFKRKGKSLYALPGVPSEMKAIINESIMKELLPKIKTDIKRYYKTFHTAGIAEAPLADLLDVEKTFKSNVSIAFLPSVRGVRLRFGVEATKYDDVSDIFENIRQNLHQKIDDYLVGDDDIDLSRSVHNLIIDKKKTLSVAESCTAGLLGAEFTKFSGSSAYFKGGIQVYSNKAKIDVLGVSSKNLEKHGAVSEKTAIEMAEKTRKKFGTDYGISITGIAGPEGGSEDKPVGTVWIGLSDNKGTVAQKYHFGSSREKNRLLSVSYAFYMLFKKLKNV